MRWKDTTPYKSFRDTRKVSLYPLQGKGFFSVKDTGYVVPLRDTTPYLLPKSLRVRGIGVPDSPLTLYPVVPLYPVEKSPGKGYYPYTPNTPKGYYPYTP